MFPKLVSTSDDVRKASAEAERKIDAHVLMSRFYLCCYLFIYRVSRTRFLFRFRFPPSNGLAGYDPYSRLLCFLTSWEDYRREKPYEVKARLPR